MPRIRVLVIEDSLTVRKRIVELLSSQPEFEVVGEAEDGKTAIELCQALRPDVLTVDLVLPVLSGLSVTEYVMAYCPTPILIVSSSRSRGEFYRTFDALAAGALDVLDKPSGEEGHGEWEHELLDRIKLISRIKVITHVRERIRNRAVLSPDRAAAVQPGLAGEYRAAAIGASTGGPAAMLEVLRRLPPDFPLPILVVIHIAESFAGLLAEWLDTQSQLRVRCAVEGEALPARGQVILAPPGCHLVLSGGHLRLTHDAERHSCRPSIDVLFESMAAEMGSQTIACLLTGMGKDGARGLLAVRRAGGRTIAQDEATSVIFGMPQEAIRIGAAERVLGCGEIAPALMALTGCAERTKT